MSRECQLPSGEAGKQPSAGDTLISSWPLQRPHLPSCRRPVCRLGQSRGSPDSMVTVPEYFSEGRLECSTVLVRSVHTGSFYLLDGKPLCHHLSLCHLQSLRGLGVVVSKLDARRSWVQIL